MPDPQIDYDRMNEKQRGEAASWFAKIYGFRAIILTFAAAVVMAQPIFLMFYKDRDLARAAENLKIEKQSDSAFALSRAAISEVTQLSAQYGEVKTENENLRRQFDELTKKYNDLMEKYHQMETAYHQTLGEKRTLEGRIDELFKKHLGDESPQAPK